MAQSKKSRKFDRNRKSAANVAYKLGNRRKVNSDKKQARNVKHSSKEMAVPRGTARAKRRLSKQQAWRDANAA